MLHNGLAGLVDTTVHVNDQLILEANVGVEEEVVEVLLEATEEWLAYLVLDGCWQLVVEWEFFDDEVEIVNESILNELFNRVIKLIRYLFFLVAVLKPQKPEIKLLHPRIDQGFERLITGKHDADGACQEREEGEANEFDSHGEKILYCGLSSDVTISYCSDGSQDEVEGVCIDWQSIVPYHSRFRRVVRTHLIGDEYIDPPIFVLLPNKYPKACHNVRKKQNCQLKLYEVNIFTNFLLGVSKPAHKNLLNNQVQLFEEPIEMDKSC